MNKTTKKVLSLVLMMIMILSSVPMTSFALTMCDMIGHNVEMVVTKEATCTEAGVKTEKCTRSNCDYTTNKTEVIPLKSHTIATIDAVSPTCGKTGNTAGAYCAVCDLITVPCETIPALGHTLVDFPAVQPTCGVNGNNAGKKCSICNEVISGGEPIIAGEHDYKQISFEAGSCKDNTPTTEVKKCKVCGDTKTTTKAAECDFGTWITQSIPTCSVAGKMTRTCSECGTTEEKTIDKTPHTEVVVIAEAATCDKAGKNAGKKCTICGAITQGCEVIPATGHREKVVAGYAASCGKKGLSDGSYCEVCNKELRVQVEIAALDHIIEIDNAASIKPTCSTDGYQVEKCVRVGCGYTNNVVLPKTHGEGLKVVTPATCTTAGKKSGYCTSCNQTVVETIAPLGHVVTNELSWIVLESPNCDKEGKRVATCARCGGQAVEVIPALSHVEAVYTPAKAPTCKEEGATESKQCTICKTITVKAEKIDKLEHTFGDWTETKTATCKVAGVKEAVCTVCGEKKLETIDRLPHTEEIIPAVEATCDKDGSTMGVTCTVCKEVLEKVTLVEALGHNYIKDEANSVEPLCELEGKFYGTCDRCGHIKDEIVPAKGHDNDVTPGYPADCTLSGVSDGKTCKVCGKVTAEPEQIPALGHDFVVDANTSTPATCETNGFENLNCSRCKATDRREAPATGHSFGEWEVTVQPTCDKQGEKTRTCVTAGCGKTEMEYIESNGSHDVQIKAAKDPTCTEKGLTQGSYCVKCNEIFEVQEEVEALGHKIDGVDPTLTKATTKKDGSYAIKCERCDELVNPKVIYKIDEKSIKLSTATCTYNGKERKPSVTVKDSKGNVLKSGTDYTVKYPSGRKAVGEYKITVTFKGNYSGSKNLIFTIAPAKTSKITATSSQKEYVKLSWKAVEGATGYRVYVYETIEGKTRKKVASVNGKTTYNLQKDYLGDTMAVGAQYKVAVVAYTKLADGTVIHALAGTAYTFTRTPGKPSLTVTSASGKANLKWTNVEDESGYQVYYATSENGEYKKLTSTTKNEYSKAFTKGKTLYFKVRAYTKFNDEVTYGKFSDIAKITIK